MVGLELILAPNAPILRDQDVRHAFVLWDPRGRPHTPYPEMVLERPMTGREVLEAQARLWEAHVEAARRRFGKVPLVGVTPEGQPLRGLLAFRVDGIERFNGGRWTLVLHRGPLWRFSREQILDGTRRPLAPSSEVARE
ncbi:MAG: hypothetical protein M5U01_39500 [Ardenticatenaceae bacterium]|nr:hypothetical protein [Ardenticatenaceae bacterium]